MLRILLVLATLSGLVLLTNTVGQVGAQAAPTKAESPETPSFKVRIPDRHLPRETANPGASGSLRVDLTEGGSSVLALEYEGDTTEIPVISPRFVAAQSESEVDRETYHSRSDRSVKLAFEVRSSPKNFGPYDVLIEHWHADGENDRFLRTYRLANYQTFAVYPVSIPNAQPGVNIYVLRIRFRDRVGVQTVAEGGRHLVVVHDAAATNFQGRSSVSSGGVGRGGIWRGDATLSVDLTLSPALSLGKARVRISRRGERLRGGAEVLREPVWKVIHASDLADLQSIVGVDVEAGETPRSFRISVRHECASTARSQEFLDRWKYKVELIHESYPNVLAAWNFNLVAEREGNNAGHFTIQNQ